MPRYCMGFEYVESRSPTTEEREFVERLVEAAARRFSYIRAGLAGVVAALLGSTIAAVLGAQSWPYAVFLLALLALIPLTLAYRDARKASCFVRSAVPFEVVECYGLRDGKVGPVVDPRSGLLVSYGGIFSSRIFNVGLQVVAQRSAELESVGAVVRDPKGRRRRSLSPPELEELRAIVRSRPLIPRSWDLLLYSWVCVSVFAASADSKTVVPPACLPLAVAGLTLVALLLWLRMRPAMLLRRDLAAGVALEFSDGVHRMEFLPRSGLIWTREHDPALIRLNPMAPRAF